MKRFHILIVLLAVMPAGLLSAYYHEYRDPASGVRVICGTEPDMFPSSWRRGRVRGRASTLDRTTALRKLAILKEELKKYPAAFLRRHLRRVYILRKLSFFGLNYGGTYFVRTRTVYIISASPNYFRQLFHAEFSSIIYKRNLRKFSKSAWKGANDPGFSYGKGGRNALRGGRSSTRFAERWHRKGLLYQYGSASVEEDINSYARNIFAAKSGFWRIVSRFPRVARKVRLISLFYGKLHSRFTLRYFRSLDSRSSRYPMPADRRNSDNGGGMDRDGDSGDRDADSRDGGGDGGDAAGFSGRWKSTYGTLVLKKSGTRITGTYGYRGGRISGTVRGNRLDFVWTEKGGRTRGLGYFILSGDGRRFSGKWGYRDSRTNGGRWTGRRTVGE